MIVKQLVQHSETYQCQYTDTRRLPCQYKSIFIIFNIILQFLQQLLFADIEYIYLSWCIANSTRVIFAIFTIKEIKIFLVLLVKYLEVAGASLKIIFCLELVLLLYKTDQSFTHFVLACNFLLTQFNILINLRVLLSLLKIFRC